MKKFKGKGEHNINELEAMLDERDEYILMLTGSHLGEAAFKYFVGFSYETVFGSVGVSNRVIGRNLPVRSNEDIIKLGNDLCGMVSDDIPGVAQTCVTSLLLLER